MEIPGRKAPTSNNTGKTGVVGPIGNPIPRTLLPQIITLVRFPLKA
jgi:hypothetical protein